MRRSRASGQSERGEDTKHWWMILLSIMRSPARPFAHGTNYFPISILFARLHSFLYTSLTRTCFSWEAWKTVPTDATGLNHSLGAQNHFARTIQTRTCISYRFCIFPLFTSWTVHSHQQILMPWLGNFKASFFSTTVVFINNIIVNN